MNNSNVLNLEAVRKFEEEINPILVDKLLSIPNLDKEFHDFIEKINYYHGIILSLIENGELDCFSFNSSVHLNVLKKFIDIITNPQCQDYIINNQNELLLVLKREYQNYWKILKKH